MSCHLPERITALSVVQQYPEALGEWTLVEVNKVDDVDRCLCSHPIHEIYVIRNLKNNNAAQVGSCCIKKFAEQSEAFVGMHTVAKCVERIKQDASKAPNTGLIEQAARSGMLTPWEVQFLTDTKAKRALTAKQEVTRNRINNKLISSIGTTAQESFEQLKKSLTASPNVKLIDKALEQKVIRPQDGTFLKQISAKAHEALSDKQKSYKTSLNQRIINQIKL
jgi:hypothetical protein